MRTAVQQHIMEEFRLVNLTSIGTGNSDPDGDFLLDEIRQEVVRAITRDGLYAEIPGLVRPGNPAVGQKHVDIMTLGMGDLG